MLVTVKQWLGPNGGYRDVIISTNHVVYITPTPSLEKHSEVHMQQTSVGMQYVIVPDEEIQKITGNPAE